MRQHGVERLPQAMGKTRSLSALTPAPRRVVPHPMLRLQRAIGNRAARSLLTQASHSRLAVTEPDDPCERGADRIADAVMRAPDVAPPTDAIPSAPSGHVQRMCAECEEEEERRLQRSATPRRTVGPPQTATLGSPGPPFATPAVHEVLRSPGRSLAPDIRAEFEPRLGRGLEDVRVHTDSRAEESARAVSARAYTVGNHIVFGSGEYAPHTETGRRLLAHELVHTLQQGARSDLIMRSTKTDGMITFHTAYTGFPRAGEEDYTIGDTAVELLLAAQRYQLLREDLERAFNSRRLYGQLVPVNLHQYSLAAPQNRVLCGNDAAGCCQNCDENCGGLGIATPNQFLIYAQVFESSGFGLRVPRGFPAGAATSPEVATASVMYHELLHLWFYQFLCLFRNQSRVHPSGHDGAYDSDFASMWTEAHGQLESAWQARQAAARPPAAPSPPAERPAPRTVEDLDRAHGASGPRTPLGVTIRLGGGGLAEFGPEETMVQPIIWGDVGYEVPVSESGRYRWRLAASGFGVPGKPIGGAGAQIGLRILQETDLSRQVFGRPAGPAENPFYFDFNTGILYRIDEREGEVSSPGVTGGLGAGKIWQVGGVELGVGADATYLFQWQLEHPHALIFGGHGEVRF